MTQGALPLSAIYGGGGAGLTAAESIMVMATTTNAVLGAFGLGVIAGFGINAAIEAFSGQSLGEWAYDFGESAGLIGE
jgi:hypothetical protein